MSSCDGKERKSPTNEKGIQTEYVIFGWLCDSNSFGSSGTPEEIQSATRNVRNFVLGCRSLNRMIS